MFNAPMQVVTDIILTMHTLTFIPIAIATRMASGFSIQLLCINLGKFLIGLLERLHHLLLVQDFIRLGQLLFIIISSS